MSYRSYKAADGRGQQDVCSSLPLKRSTMVAPVPRFFWRLWTVDCGLEMVVWPGDVQLVNNCMSPVRPSYCFCGTSVAAMASRISRKVDCTSRVLSGPMRISSFCGPERASKVGSSNW